MKYPIKLKDGENPFDKLDGRKVWEALCNAVSNTNPDFLKAGARLKLVDVKPIPKEKGDSKYDTRKNDAAMDNEELSHQENQKNDNKTIGTSLQSAV